jgi:hypothetical protein
MAIIAMNGAELEEPNSGQNGAGNSYAGIEGIQQVAMKRGESNSPFTFRSQFVAIHRFIVIRITFL